MNGQGLVPIRMTQTLRIGGSDFPTGETHHVYWKLAARLLAGVFAEIDKEPKAKPTAAHNVATALKALARRGAP